MMSTTGHMPGTKDTVPRALTIAGSDSGAGAGIQADLKTFAALGVYGLSALTAITAQNTSGVRAALDLPPELIEAQIDAVLEDIGTDAAKTGMLSSPAIIEAVAGRVRKWNLRLVVDPVMRAKGGDPLLQPDAVATLCSKLLPLAEVVTPNLPEAEVLTGRHIETLDDMRRAAQIIHEQGPRHVVVKGGHSTAEPVDVYFDGSRFVELHAERIQTPHTHGTGCTFSAAIAAFLARGFSVEKAVAEAKRYVTEAIRHAPGLGHGHGPVGHFWLWEMPASISQKVGSVSKFKLSRPLLCLVTDPDSPDLIQAAEIALSAGVNMLQLRGHQLSAADMYALALILHPLCQRYSAAFIVNDRIDVGLAVGAEGFQLGRRSLPLPIVRQLAGEDYLLGASVHSQEEAQAAVANGADFLIAGTIFTSRSHPDEPPIGLDLLHDIKQALPTYPLLAIGGITPENAGQAMAAGADGVAIISAILSATDVARAVHELRTAIGL